LVSQEKPSVGVVGRLRGTDARTAQLLKRTSSGELVRIGPLGRVARLGARSVGSMRLTPGTHRCQILFRVEVSAWRYERRLRRRRVAERSPVRCSNKRPRPWYHREIARGTCGEKPRTHSRDQPTSTRPANFDQPKMTCQSGTQVL